MAEVSLPGFAPPVLAPAIKPLPTPAQTAQEFEAVFLGQMAQLMLDTVESGEFSGGHAEEMMRSVMAEEIGRDMARRGGVGLAPAVLKQIILLQGGQPEAGLK